MELVDDSNSNSNPNKLTTPNHTHLFPAADGAGTGRICNWPPSRIVRVSRASGGKDRHSKVVTSKGLRDRRIRLSVSTAIEFYDLQDRLGFDQPSKAVEWLINAAASSISELPSLDPMFSDGRNNHHKKPSGKDVGFEDPNQQQKNIYNSNSNSNSNNNNNNGAVSKSSACSSTSETSKGSGVSLSRSENRIRARERARGMAAKKEKKKETVVVNGINNSGSQNSSFTDLLNGGMNSATTGTVSPMDYFQMQHYNLLEHNRFSFVQENLAPVGAAGGGGGLGSGLGRGTLQSNLLCSLSHSDQYLQRFQTSSMVGGSTSGNFQFFTAPASDVFPASGYDSECLQLYGGGRHSGHYKGK